MESSFYAIILRQIVLNVTSSEITSLLLIGGRTTHLESAFLQK